VRLSRCRECSAHRRPERSREGQARELFASLGPTYDRVGTALVDARTGRQLRRYPRFNMSLLSEDAPVSY
jgi:hypothetical protein